MLVSILRRIPGLAEELAITTSRQDHVGRGGIKVRNGSGEQPMPIHVGASSAAHELHAELTSWVRLVCESRGIDYSGSDDLLGVARWLDQHVVSLSMTEGSEEALVGITRAVNQCWRVIDLPAENDTWADPELVNQAREQRVTAIEAERLMEPLGHPRLKAAVISKWLARGKITREGGTYRLGDILDRNPRNIIGSADEIEMLR
ncbi:hypothetical protein [Rhodococcus sp. AQ5-07]|uniref:hypothetical protein n=1 Tax=Rhodococcus sp. AQ5-07 TaxID=2054902 RepID=UPI0013B36FE5|nr:hypothetical protein [Rhodococcus sp. AQ5-07]